MRRIMLILIALSVGAGPPAAGPRDRGITDTSASPHVVVRSVGLSEVRWNDGFWGRWFDTCRRHMLPSMGQIMEGTEKSQFLHNFRIAAGLEKGRHRGPPWNDGDLYKWLEAVAAVHAITREPALDRNLDGIIRILAQAQRGDGYLHTPVLIRNRAGNSEARPFQDRLDFEAYNLGHLMTAGCIHHRATGKTNLLSLACKAADYLERLFARPTPELARNAVCPAHYMGVVELYRTTRERRYLKLARKLIDMRELVVDGTDDNQDRIPFRKQTQAVGHAVRANYLYAGVADLYAETGDATLLLPLKKIWEDVISRKLYVTGACGALYDGASPDGAKDQKRITRVHQAYGRSYQLPNSTAHNETCANIGNALWNWRMLHITGDARHADVLERALLNAVLCGVSLDGKNYFYVNTLRQLDPMPVELRWSRRRQPFISCFCCPPNLVRTLAEIGGYAYGRSDRTLWVHLYGSNTLDTEIAPGARLCLTQQTEYPWNGRVTLRITAAPRDRCAIRLRIPGWCKGATLQINGTTSKTPLLPATYAEVRRRWSAGDVVELHLPMPVRLLQAHPFVEEVRNQVAIERGPVVYCLESPDLPRGVKVQDVVIPRSVKLEPRFDATLLGGITLLEGKAILSQEPEWSGELYRELTTTPARSVHVKLIPYHVWGNRGRSEMTVWMPLAR